ncbi:hypothetical protein [Xanthomonas phaseoli]|uniref:Uncharacterized protein n=1 Tax=Xanthomonas manihotis TaxID=43353 RepID=A0A8I1XM52_XANMN|nr:hypothetical protein [Xanthomonas phaseoli]MBO9719893.1 hypothetical protein [Xanthomonas phaseoli pv. manihotis]MBO9754916.1 hypothetical protein [Xanthomonas phaseoli pv. manihotis]MBO9760070.1 hypothetical protein [Xanthomonas phaseoli pv. manihotis]MBO9763623.1 hypothetical protein [Xanthomonas phaseoli pv. manihotis]MBO9784548.1 hypothetical protein [Xanthomonas phaseoli pv. manihotis]
MEKINRDAKRLHAIFIAIFTFSGAALAESIVYDDFYGTARYSTIEGALKLAQANALNEANRLQYSNCVFVGYQSKRPNFYDPDWFEVTAAYTCQKRVLYP